MALTSASRIVGAHVLIFRDGSTITTGGSGAAGRSNKPGAADVLWYDIGIVDNFDVSLDREEKEIFSPLPGKKALYDIIESKRKLSYKFTGKELSAQSMELAFGSLNLTSASTQFNPLEGVTKKVWLKAQLYDQNDVLVLTLDHYGVLKIPALAFGDDVVSPAFEFTGLHSTLNTATL